MTFVKALLEAAAYLGLVIASYFAGYFLAKFMNSRDKK